MQYHTYLSSKGMGSFGISALKHYPVRHVLHFIIFVIFTYILNTSLKGEGIIKRVLFLLITGLSFALVDEARDYVCDIMPSLGDVMIDFAGVLTSVLIICCIRIIYRVSSGKKNNNSKEA